MFDSDTPNQSRAKWKRRQQKKRQHDDIKGAKKGCVSKQADQKSRSMQNRTSRGEQARREAKRNQNDDPGEQEEPQVDLEGEC